MCKVLIDRFQNFDKWVLPSFAGFFLFFVLYFYEGFGIPGGVSPTGHGLLFRSVCFGLLAFISFSLNEFYLKPVDEFKETYHLLFWYIWELVVIWNLTYWLIKYFWGWEPFTWYGYFDLLGEISSVMLIPFGINELYKRFLTGKEKSIQKLLFEAENGRESVAVDPDKFLYITSQDNYVDIYFSVNGQIKCETLRGTLKAIQKSFSESDSVMRCHRSYIVNPDKIIHLTQSSRATKVTLTLDIEIPVSKKYLPRLKERMKAASLSHT